MDNKTVQTAGFFALLLIFFVLALAIVRPYFELLALAGILAFLFMPVYTYLHRKFKHGSPAALVTILLMLVVIGIPLYFLGQAIVREVFAFYANYKNGNLRISGDLALDNLSPAWQARVVNIIGEGAARLNTWAQNAVLNVANTLQNIAGIFLGFFVFLFSTYYFLKDSKKIKEFSISMFPLSASQRNLVVDRLVGSINGIVRGSFLFALAEGVAAIIGFYISGVPQPLVWGVVAFVASFIPAIGIAIVIVPAIFFLLIFKSGFAAIILTVWFLVINVPMSYLLPPKLIGSEAKLHPLLVLLGVLGGIALFGIPGFFFGPIVMAIFVALVGEYRTGYRS